MDKSYESFLMHYGIPGQKHGVRRFQNEDGTLTEEGKRRYGYYDKEDGTKDMKRLNSDAQKDAWEYARAKSSYGEGAGTRRKKINNRISERMKDPDYEKAFNQYLSGQNMEKHQQAATRERRAKDTAKTAKKVTKTTARIVSKFGGAILRHI